MTTNQKTRYFYLRNPQNRSIAACFAYRFTVGLKGGGTVQYAVATIHPGDQMTRELGRTIATGRLNKVGGRTIPLANEQRPVDALLIDVASFRRNLQETDVVDPVQELRKYDQLLQTMHLSRHVCDLAYVAVSSPPVA